MCKGKHTCQNHDVDTGASHYSVSRRFSFVHPPRTMQIQSVTCWKASVRCTDRLSSLEKSLEQEAASPWPRLPSAPPLRHSRQRQSLSESRPPTGLWSKWCPTTWRRSYWDCTDWTAGEGEGAEPNRGLNGGEDESDEMVAPAQ